jgi:hypothetical protein
MVFAIQLRQNAEQATMSLEALGLLIRRARCWRTRSVGLGPPLPIGESGIIQSPDMSRTWRNRREWTRRRH